MTNDEILEKATAEAARLGADLSPHDRELLATYMTGYLKAISDMEARGRHDSTH